MPNFELLETKAKQIRKDIVEMIYRASSGHPGGSLSAADIVTALYFHELNVDPNNPKDENRDRFILSKGHAAPVLYSTLMEKGFISKDLIGELRKFGSVLQGHPDMKKIPGVDISTGSLGQGLSAGNGMALAAKLDNKDYRTYVVMGDGEQQEGQVWEAAMTAAYFKLDNICAFVDHNGLQLDGFIKDIMEVDPLDEKWRAFGWNVINIDGHDFKQIIDALEAAKACKGKPTMIIAKTVKGKGVSFMEGSPKFHGMAPNDEEYKKAMEEL